MPLSDKKILSSLYENREGLRVKTLIKLTELSSRTIYRRLKILKKKDLIKHIFPIWTLSNGGSVLCPKLIKEENIFELHNISYIVKLLKIPAWWDKRKNYLIRLKEWQFKEVNFGKSNSNPYIQLMNENFVIQCYPESLIIIARKRYYSNDPYQTSIQAINDVVDLLEWFCERFRFNFWCNGVPHIEVRNNDFNRLNDAIANKVKEEGGKFLVEVDKRRKVWIDMSEPFGKEANYPRGQEKLEKITKDYLIKDVLLPSEIQGLVFETSKNINQVTQNQLVFAENMKSHIDAIKKLGKEVNGLSRIIKGLKTKNQKLELELKNQKTLKDF